MKRLLLPLIVVLLAFGVLQLKYEIKEQPEIRRQLNLTEKIKQVIQVKVESKNLSWYNEGYQKWQGTGVFIADDLVLTAGHVVNDANQITVIFANGKEYKAESWYQDSEVDLGVVVVKTSEVEPTAKFCNAILGEIVWAIGNPFGIFPVVTKGIISAINMPDDFSHTKNMLIVDCAINPGNSGCPVFNRYGDILGICSWGYNNSQGMSYFVRAEICKLVLEKYYAAKALENIE